MMGRLSLNGSKLVFGDLNALIGQHQIGEDNVLGDFCFGRIVQHQIDTPNRDLLLEWCQSSAMITTNTFCPQPQEKLVTYHEPHVGPADPVSETGFAMLDFFLVGAHFQDS